MRKVLQTAGLVFECVICFFVFHINIGGFQEDALSPLLLVIVLIPFNLILRKAKFSFELNSDNGSTTYCIWVTLSCLAKPKEDFNLSFYIECECLVMTSVRVMGSCIGMNVGIGKGPILAIVSGKVTTTVGH